MKIDAKTVREGAKLPYCATEGSAGYDLFACVDKDTVIESGKIKMIPIGIALEIPAGYAGFIFPRSSLGVKYGITLPNCVGVIDSDYRGEFFVPLINLGEQEFTVRNGDRIAQLVIMRVENVLFEKADDLSDTVRGEGGFGSTGRR